MWRVDSHILRKTMDFLDTVIGDPNNRLVDWVTIHPRTRQTPSTTPIRTEALEILTTKYSKILPVLLSGDIFDIDSLPFTSYPSSDPSAPSTPTTARPSNTGLSGFMSARGLLANPALFDGHTSTPWEAVEYFMCRVMRAPIPLKLTVHHLSEMCGPGMGSDKHALLSRRERAGMTQMEDLLELIDFLDEKMMKELGREMRRDL
jgi:tRNA-dihydrouridine synthase 4